MEDINPVTSSYAISDFGKIKNKVLNWTKQFSTFCFLDSHQYAIEPHSMECLVGAGERDRIRVDPGDALAQLRTFQQQKNRWLFGHLGYNLNAPTSHPDHIGFAKLFFFEPEVVIRISNQSLIIEADDPNRVYNAIIDCDEEIRDHVAGNIDIQQRLTREEYIDVIGKLRTRILRGDCYEINFCQEFFAEHATIDPLLIYDRLSTESPNPFSALYRVDDRWLICASPERYLRKEGRHILSQPIKGTARRTTDEKADAILKEELFASSKDRSENVMIVDLVRNDLAKICEEGSVRVDELYGIYSFPQVHQMISTISGTLRRNVDFTEVIAATFPMGSMTGAPKKRVMELIERYEIAARGIFSGAVGYINPDGDFDFNVVIRSIMYNARNRYLSFQAGSGITFYSDPVKEWEECLVKVSALKKVLEQPS